MATKNSVPVLILSSYPYLRSAMVRFPLVWLSDPALVNQPTVQYNVVELSVGGSVAVAVSFGDR